MLVLRYFVFVGGALLALLLVCAAMLPTPPVTDSTVASADDLPMIRIHSERKWPERIVLDTNASMPAAVQIAKAEQPGVVQGSEKARVRAAFAQLPADQPKQVAAEVKKPGPKPVVKRRVARARVAPSPYGPSYYAPPYYGYGYGRHPRMMQVAQQPRFGLFW